MFRNRLIKALPKANIPKFQMVLKNHRINHNGRKSNAQEAYAIEVSTHMSSQPISSIKEATKDTKEFVPFQTRRRNPAAFQGAIRYHHTLAIQQVIVINYVGQEAMHFLTDRIRAISGIIDVVPTRKVKETGRYIVIVNKQNIQSVWDKLKKKFDQWYTDAVPEDARPRSGQYAGVPAIGTPRYKSFSEGDQSWITNSTQSFMSFSVASMEANGVTTEDQCHLDRT